MIQIILTHHWPAGLLFPLNFVSAHFTNREWIQLLWGNLEPLNHIQINLALGFVTLSGQTTSTTSSLRLHSFTHTFYRHIVHYIRYAFIWKLSIKFPVRCTVSVHWCHLRRKHLLWNYNISALCLATKFETSVQKIGNARWCPLNKYYLIELDMLTHYHDKHW